MLSLPLSGAPWWQKIVHPHRHFQLKIGVKLHCSTRIAGRRTKLANFLRAYFSNVLKEWYRVWGSLNYPRLRPLVVKNSIFVREYMPFLTYAKHTMLSKIEENDYLEAKHTFQKCPVYISKYLCLVSFDRLWSQGFISATRKLDFCDHHHGNRPYRVNDLE